jgi:hypothetical protein
MIEIAMLSLSTHFDFVIITPVANN